MMPFTTLLAACYVAQLLGKTILAFWYGRRYSSRRISQGDGVCILQPILSGDPQLEKTLAANVSELPSAAFVWLIDETDSEALAVAGRIIQMHPERRILIEQCPPAPEATNPKTFKLQIGLMKADEPFCAVLDDDTQVTCAALGALLEGLHSGATVATGLPSYRLSPTMPGRMVAEFVNSFSIQTYLSSAALAEPFALNGMFYAGRTSELRRLGVFQETAGQIADDLAVARMVRMSGGRIHQSCEPQLIGTTIESWRAFAWLIHRWFVFTWLLVSSRPVLDRCALLVSFAMPPVLLWAVVIGAHTWSGVIVLCATLALRLALLRAMKHRFFPKPWDAPFSSVTIELLLPAFLILALISKRIRWRSRRIRVRSLTAFDYL